jgi:hypothetical protein
MRSFKEYVEERTRKIRETQQAGQAAAPQPAPRTATVPVQQPNYGVAWNWYGHPLYIQHPQQATWPNADSQDNAGDTQPDDVDDMDDFDGEVEHLPLIVPVKQPKLTLTPSRGLPKLNQKKSTAQVSSGNQEHPAHPRTPHWWHAPSTASPWVGGTTGAKRRNV